jgi:dihydrofolate reductase
VLEGDVVEAVRALKAADGPALQLGCGADLLTTLSKAGLVDAYRLLITTTVLGQGKGMFASFREPLRLRLTGTRTFETRACPGPALHPDRP